MGPLNPFKRVLNAHNQTELGWHGRCSCLADLFVSLSFLPLNGLRKEGLKWPND
jgi:hypothetical protein